MLQNLAIVENRIVEVDSGRGQLVVAIAPDEAERGALQAQFQLDDYDLSAALDPDEVPRLESIGGRALLIWKVPETVAVSEAVEFAVSVVGLSLLSDRLAFIHSGSGISFADREFRSIADPRDVMLAFLLRTVRHFVGHLRVIKQISSEVERKITVSMENKHLLQMFNLSESLVYFVDAIEGNAAVLAKLRGIGSSLGFDSRQLEILDDILLENTQAARQAGIYSSVLSGLMDARGTIVNNNMNVLLKNLTLINIVFLPLNLIASIGGMSEWSMMTSGVDWRVAYSLFCLGMVLFGWITWIFMRKVIERRSVRADRGSAAQAALRDRRGR